MEETKNESTNAGNITGLEQYVSESEKTRINNKELNGDDASATNLLCKTYMSNMSKNSKKSLINDVPRNT